ncbi:hypothetical protein HYU45_02555 [Candidatus Daviesbacteria bacterium]|nr:hypothetical protein [Candidatus Daviesbacteria bacterium]
MNKVVNKRSLWIFLLCAVVVVLTQFSILRPIIDFSLFTEDDWNWLFYFRSLPDLNFLQKLFLTWTKIGIHEGGYAIYIGILGILFGNHYSLYQYVNIAFKIIATLTLFPLILILFRNRLLALLTTVIYGINSASTGSFYWFMKGGIFPAIALMNLFFITYYYTMIKKTKILLMVSSVLIILSYLNSPTRIFPLFFIIFGVETYWIIKYKSPTTVKNSIIRLVCFLLPSILIAMIAPVSPNGRVVETPGVLLSQILAGNWFNLLSPFAGIGYSLLTVENMRIFGFMDFSTFASLNNYLSYLAKGSVWIFLLSLFFLSLLIPRKPLRFIITAFCINFVLDILMYFIASHHLTIAPGLVQQMDPSLFFLTKYPTLVAIFILVVALMAFWEWLKGKKDYLLVAITIGPVFSLIFLSLMWVTIAYLLDGYNSIHYYFQIPAIGISLFFAAVLVLFYKKFKKKYARMLVAVMITGIIIGFYRSSSFAINREFLGIYPENVRIKDQQILHGKLIKKMGEFNRAGNILVYFELPKDNLSFKYYKRALLLDSISFATMIKWQVKGDGSGCIGSVNDINILISSYQLKDGKEGFITSGRCRQVTEKNVFYNLDDLYAYKVEKGEFIDIKDNLLKELKLP